MKIYEKVRYNFYDTLIIASNENKVVVEGQVWNVGTVCCGRNGKTYIHTNYFSPQSFDFNEVIVTGVSGYFNRVLSVEEYYSLASFRFEFKKEDRIIVDVPLIQIPLFNVSMFIVSELKNNIPFYMFSNLIERGCIKYDRVQGNIEIKPVIYDIIPEPFNSSQRFECRIIKEYMSTKFEFPLDLTIVLRCEVKKEYI